MNLSSWALKSPIRVALITFGLILAGALAIINLNREFIPPITEPSALVVTLWPQASAEDIERQLTTVLENSFSSISGLKSMRSKSHEGYSVVRLNFDEDLDINLMIQEVRTRIDHTSRNLPEGIEGRPVVSKAGSEALPVFTFAASTSHVDPGKLGEFVDDRLLPAIYQIDGVSLVRVYGKRDRIWQIRMDIEDLKEYGVTPIEVYGALKKRKIQIPAGLIRDDGKTLSIKAESGFKNIEDLEKLYVGVSATGPILLSDVATIESVYKDAKERMRSDGQDVVVIQVTKRAEANTIQINNAMEQLIDDFEQEGWEFTILQDNRNIILQSLTTVGRTAILGLLMAIVVILLFLKNIRYTLVIAVSLPVSIATTLVMMRIAGLSINILTMAGLTVSLGMIVDAAIVVLENIQRHRALGDNALSATLNGTNEVSGAVLASISTSICVFIPLLFLKGIVGIVLKDLSYTLIFALGASLFSALFVLPVLACRIIKSAQVAVDKPKIIITILGKAYRRAIESCIKRRALVIIIALTLLGASVATVRYVGITFIPAADYDEIFISMQLNSGSSLEVSRNIADQVDDLLRKNIAGIADTVFFVGMENDLVGAARQREEIWAQIILKDDRTADQNFKVIMKKINDLLKSRLSDIQFAVLNGGFDRLVFLATNGAGYRIELASNDWTDLVNASDHVEKILQNDPRIIATERSIDKNNLSISANLNPDALNTFGIDAPLAAMTARLIIDSTPIGDLKTSDGDVQEIYLTSSLKDTENMLDSIGNVQVRGKNNKLVDFQDIADLVKQESILSIDRHNRKRIITVIGYSQDENIEGIGSRFKEAIADTPLPESVSWTIGGAGGLINDSINRLVIVLIVSLLLVYAVMAMQFQKWTLPILVMSVIPFCFIGIIGGLMVFDSNISLVSFLGFIALGGIVVNNAIVQIERIGQLRSGGMNLEQAIAEGCVQRLRPILMTTITTFVAVMPVALAQGAGARIYAPMGQAIAGGLISSTLVSLFLIPVLYHISEHGKENRHQD